MSILRNELKRNYSQIPNEMITDKTISAGELRVLLYLYTKPDTWDVYNKDICNQLDISEQTLTKYWKSLLKSKWLRREIAKDENGKLTGGYEYHLGIFTISIKSTETVKSIEHSNTKPIKQKETNSANEKEFEYLFARYKEIGKEKGFLPGSKTNAKKAFVKLSNKYSIGEIRMGVISETRKPFGIRHLERVLKDNDFNELIKDYKEENKEIGSMY